jgi:hypothetical protein
MGSGLELQVFFTVFFADLTLGRNSPAFLTWMWKFQLIKFPLKQAELFHSRLINWGAGFFYN